LRAARLTRKLGYHLVSVSPQERAYLDNAADQSTPLPKGAESALRPGNPRLSALRESYARLDLPVNRHSRWAPDVVDWLVDLRSFRGDTLFVWHFRELHRVTMLKYFIYGEYVRSRDPGSLIDRLGEDGAFGCWTFEFDQRGRFSRDLLDSVNQIYFLDRHLGVLERPSLRVLDIGAGYGRLAHRMAQAVPNLTDYCCLDAVPEGTFLSEYYLGYRGVIPPARVVPLDLVDSEVEPDAFDLAVNIHSFSEIPYAAIEWWIAMLARLRVPKVLFVPNDRDRLLSLEPDGSRRDFSDLLGRAGYRLAVTEPVIEDAAVEALTGFDFRFMLFELA
jgi:hypothetical protein